MLNKQKLIQKHKLNPFNTDELTPYQIKLLGIKQKQPELLMLSTHSEKELIPLQILTTPKGSSNKFQPKTLGRGNKVSITESVALVPKIIPEEGPPESSKVKVFAQGKVPPASARDGRPHKLSPAKSIIITMNKKKPQAQEEKIKL
jgi:hypothetical protein